MPWLPFGALAMTLWPFVLYRRGHHTHCIWMHEMAHFRDQGRWGVLWPVVYGLPYLFWNVVMLVRHKPADWHPMEREAYNIERECLQRVQRPVV